MSDDCLMFSLKKNGSPVRTSDAFYPTKKHISIVIHNDLHVVLKIFTV